MNIRLSSPLLISLSILVIQAPAVFAADKVQLVTLNNEGVRALNDGKFDTAIDKLEQALKVDPGYNLARDNLSKAFNNYALKKKDEPKEAIKLLHLAAYLDPQDKAVLDNINGVVRLMGRKPDSFQDRVELGDQANKAADFPGALLEYEAALSIKDDSDVRQKLSHVVIPAQWTAIAKAKPDSKREPGSSTPDFTDFMANLEKTLKSHWHPPTDVNEKVEVTFKVASSGAVSDVKVSKSSGSTLADQAALQALKDASPVSPLPKGSDSKVDIQFTFSSNLAGKGTEEDEAYWKKQVLALQKSGGPDLANALVGLGDCYENDGSYDECEKLYKHAIKIFESRNNDADKSDLVSALLSLGNLYFTDLDRDQEAEALFRRAVSLVQKSAKPDEVDLAQAQFRLGKLLVADYDQYGEAITVLKNALALVKKHPSDLGDEWETATAVALGNAYFDDDQYTQALPLFQSALQATEKQTDTNADSDDLAQRYKDVADCLNQMDRSDEALPLFEKSLALFKNIPDADADDVSEVQDAIAQIKNGSSNSQSSTASDATTTSGSPSKVTAAAKSKESEKIDQWLPWVLGVVWLILGVLWYRDRRESKDQANWPKPKD